MVPVKEEVNEEQLHDDPPSTSRARSLSPSQYQKVMKNYKAPVVGWAAAAQQPPPQVPPVPKCPPDPRKKQPVPPAGPPPKAILEAVRYRKLVESASYWQAQRVLEAAFMKARPASSTATAAKSMPAPSADMAAPYMSRSFSTGAKSMEAREPPSAAASSSGGAQSNSGEELVSDELTREDMEYISFCAPHPMDVQVAFSMRKRIRVYY